jgi:hypothetical protein
VPPSISFANSTSSINDLSDFGNPSAAYPASTCNISQFFGAQQLVLDITLCGDWCDLYHTSIFRLKLKFYVGPESVLFTTRVAAPGQRASAYVTI